jgi:membrane peptidoglycan carboxypeptidase
MGITTKLPAYPAIALGAVGVTPLEMASAYGTLATGGVHYAPVAITKIVGPDGKLVYKVKPKGKRALKASVAKATTDVLRGVVTGGTGTRANIGRPQAGKTGTSEKNRDVWFVGYTPQLSTAVWVGHRKEKTIIWNGGRAFGGTVAAPIWAEFMRKALAGEPKLQFASAPKPTYNSSKFKIPGGQPPKLAGKTLEEVLDELKGSGYDITVKYVKSTLPKGTVVSAAFSDQKVVIIVSNGEPPTKPKPPTKPPVKPPTDPGGGGSGEPTPPVPPPTP